MYAESLAGFEKSRQEAAAQKQQVDPAVAYNRELVSHYENAMNALANEFAKFSDKPVDTKKAVQDWEKQVDQAIAQGQMPDQATAEAYESAVRDLETSSVGQTYVVARSNFEKLMARVNQQISEGMEKGATSSIITLG